MKKKNGFTLIEMLLVVVIMAIVAAITIPSIMKMMENSKNKKYVEYENILKENLKLYNHDHNEDIWNNNQAQTLVNYQDLLKTNPDIKIDGCQVNNPGLVIDSNGSEKYTYHACITCTDQNNKVIYTSSDTCSYTETNAPTNPGSGTETDPSNPEATTKLLCTVSQNNNSLSIFTNKTDSSITYSFDGKNYSKNNTLNITKSGSYTGYAKDSNNNVTSCTLSDAYVDVGANTPSLATGMIAVYYSTADNNWHKADLTNKNVNYRWYDYSNGMWANVVTASATNRTTYLNAPLGTVIPMSDINTMFVWIPRFNAVTPSNYNGGTYSSPGAINVTLAKTTQTAIDAFTFGTQALNGIWVGKFTITGSVPIISNNSNQNLNGYYCLDENCDISNVKIIPDQLALTSMHTKDFFYLARSMQKTNNPYGFNSSTDTTLNTHMIKNREWGAIAYFTHSIYGRCSNLTTCSEVSINNSSKHYTGRSSGEKYSNNTIISSNGTYAYSDSQGQLASTTGTIYGIYDMTGIEQRVMGNYGNSTQTSGFESSWFNNNSIYYDKYTNNGCDPTYNYKHALNETDYWYGGVPMCYSVDSAWILRGITSKSLLTRELFAYDYDARTGGTDSDISTRIILTIK